MKKIIRIYLGITQEESIDRNVNLVSIHSRPKSRLEMIRISAAVMGIEFCYAAETAFVSPTLLKIGVRHAQMTLIWCLSPFVGFFLTPILGSLSDNCTSPLGRRRPFIILLSIGIILGKRFLSITSYFSSLLQVKIKKQIAPSIELDLARYSKYIYIQFRPYTLISKFIRVLLEKALA